MNIHMIHICTYIYVCSYVVIIVNISSIPDQLIRIRTYVQKFLSSNKNSYISKILLIFFVLHTIGMYKNKQTIVCAHNLHKSE